MTKKAIVTVSFGSSHSSAIDEDIEPVEKRLNEVFQEHEVFRAFTSKRIIAKLKELGETSVLDISACLQKLCNEGYSEIIVQPLHIIAGHEYEKVKEATMRSQRNHPDITWPSRKASSLRQDGLPKSVGCPARAVEAGIGT